MPQDTHLAKSLVGKLLISFGPGLRELTVNFKRQKKTKKLCGAVSVL